MIDAGDDRQDPFRALCWLGLDSIGVRWARMRDERNVRILAGPTVDAGGGNSLFLESC